MNRTHLRQRGGEVDRVRRRIGRAFGQEDVFQAREFFAPRLDLAPVECFGGDQRTGIADRHAGFDRLRAESREHRRENAAVFQRAERADVEFRDAAKQRRNPVAFRNPALRQHIGKAIDRRAERGIAEIADAVVTADPAQGKLVAAPGFDMAVDRLVGDIEAAIGKPIKEIARLRPGERPGVLFIIDEIGSGTVFGTFSDSFRTAHVHRCVRNAHIRAPTCCG